MSDTQSFLKSVVHTYISLWIRKDQNFTTEKQGSEFSSYEIELQNRVTQNDVTLQITNSKSKNKKFHFELLTWSRKIKSYTSSY